MLNEMFTEDQVIFDRPHLILDSDHARFMPEGARNMTMRELVNLFGSSTIGHYLKDQERKNSSTYRANASVVYQRLKRVRYLWKQLGTQLCDLEKAEYAAEDFKAFVQDAYELRTLRADIMDSALSGNLSRAIKLCAEQREAPKSAYEAAVEKIEARFLEEINSSADPAKNKDEAERKARSRAEKQARNGEAVKVSEGE
jgi:hypothetical protein